MARQRVLVHAEVACRVEGCASGSAHASENPCDSMPIAVLDLVLMFANPDQRYELTQELEASLMRGSKR